MSRSFLVFFGLAVLAAVAGCPPAMPLKVIGAAVGCVTAQTFRLLVAQHRPVIDEDPGSDDGLRRRGD